MFDWENAIALHAMQGNRASSSGEGEVSWLFSSCSKNLGYILELWRGWPFKTHVSSAVGTHVYSCLRGTTQDSPTALECNRDTFPGDVGDPGSLSSCHWYIRIPINFQEESGIVSL